TFLLALRRRSALSERPISSLSLIRPRASRLTNRASPFGFIKERLPDARREEVPRREADEDAMSEPPIKKFQRVMRRLGDLRRIGARIPIGASLKLQFRYECRTRSRRLAPSGDNAALPRRDAPPPRAALPQSPAICRGASRIRRAIHRPTCTSTA